MLLQAGVLTRKQVAEKLQQDDIIAFNEKELKALENDFGDDEEIEEIEEIPSVNNSLMEKFKSVFKR